MLDDIAPAVVNEAVVADTPDPAAPVVDDAADFGSSLVEFGLDEIQEPATPLPGDATPLSVVAPVDKPGEKIDVPAVPAKPADAAPVKPADAAPVTIDPEKAAADFNPDAKPEDKPASIAPVVDATADDPELSAEANALVQSRPEAERDLLRQTLKAAKFEDHYRSAKPIESVRDYLEKASGSRYGELTDSVIEKTLADPAAAHDYFSRNPERYAKVAEAVFKGDPKYFTDQLTGRTDKTPEQVREAIAFQERYKDAVPTVDNKVETLTPDELAEIEAVFPDMAKKIAQHAEGSSSEAELAKLQDEVKQFRQAKAAEEETKRQAEVTTRQTTMDTTWDKSYDRLSGYVDTKVEPVSDTVRTTAPDVANLMDVRRTALIRGLGDFLPQFDKGLGQTFAKNDIFMERLTNMHKFAEKGELDNAQRAADSLKPFVDKYLDMRKEHPIVKWLDQAIASAQTSQAVPPKADPFVPGNPNAGSQPAPLTDANARIENLIENFGVPE